jgi:histidinol-phosphate aminotransferase
MNISRRNFFCRIAAGVAAGAAASDLEALAQAAPDNRSSSSPPEKTIRLDMNANPYGPSPKVLKVIRENPEMVNQYPDSEYGPLVEQIARFHKVRPGQVTIGAGSREILRMATGAYLAEGKRLVLASPTFEPMAGFAKQAKAEVAAVPLNKRFAHDLDAMLHQTTAAAALVYICNPNNPTGSLTPRRDIEAFLERLPPNVMVLIDEAYHEYVGPSSDYASFLDHPVDDKRVIVVRTFSKIYGLAGLRLGYAVSSEEVSQKLSILRLERGVNILAALAAIAALDDPDYVRLSFKKNADSRQEFYNQTNVRMLRQIDSLTNFVFMKTGLPSTQVIEHFRRNNITLGPAVPQMERYVRVTVRTPEDMREFWRVWDLQSGGSHNMASNQSRTNRTGRDRGGSVSL